MYISVVYCVRKCLCQSLGAGRAWANSVAVAIAYGIIFSDLCRVEVFRFPKCVDFSPLFFQMSEVLVGTDGGVISLDSERALVEISLQVWRKWSAKALSSSNNADFFFFFCGRA